MEAYSFSLFSPASTYTTDLQIVHKNTLLFYSFLYSKVK